MVRFDNEQGKGNHKHVSGEEVPYVFRDIPSLLKDFRDEIERAGGAI
ncbi:toxin-antitoxin system TumE family protein [Geobacter argillaceus]